MSDAFVTDSFRKRFFPVSIWMPSLILAPGAIAAVAERFGPINFLIVQDNVETVALIDPVTNSFDEVRMSLPGGMWLSLTM